MAEKIKLKSIFTSEDTYTVLQLILKMIKIIDANEDITQADIDELKEKVNEIFESKLLEYIHINEQAQRTIIGNNLEVDGSDFLLAGRDSRINHYADGIGQVTNIQHQTPEGLYKDLLTIRDTFVISSPDILAFSGSSVRMRSYQDGVWHNVDFDIKNDVGNYITALRMRKNDNDSIELLLSGQDSLATEKVVAGRLKSYSKALYQHTVYFEGSGIHIAFTAMSSSNTPIDSYQDLTTVFGGCRIACTGVFPEVGSQNGAPVFIDLHGGTVTDDFIRVWTGQEALNIKLTDMLSKITITDDVCVPK